MCKKVREIHITYLESDKTEKLAYIYGFKNIQNLVRKLKCNKKIYDYCEVMACPQGCVGGGG